MPNRAEFLAFPPLHQRHARTACTALALAIALAPAVISAQHIRGKVSEVASETPLAEALLTLRDQDSTLVGIAVSGSDGGFEMRVPPRDGMLLYVERLGYAPTVSVPLSLAIPDTLTLEIHLRPSPIALSPVTAAVASRPNWNLVQFLRRADNGFGRYAGPAEIGRLRYNSVVDLLMQVDPARFVPIGPGGQAIIARAPPNPNLRTNSLIPGYCTPRVFVDGTMVQDSISSGGLTGRGRSGLPPAVPVGWYVAPSEVRGIEVYKVPHQAPPQFQGAFGGDCPVVAIWTERGFRLPR